MFFEEYDVAILILLELTLQYNPTEEYLIWGNGRNPYFIGINSAIKSNLYITNNLIKSQSLFYWN